MQQTQKELLKILSDIGIEHTTHEQQRPMKERTMALAGIFQATELVRQAANHGTWSG